MNHKQWQNYFSESARKMSQAWACFNDEESEWLEMERNRQDIEITMEMWRRARAEAAMQYYDSIKQLARNPNGDTCNSLENEIIEILGAGV